MFFLLFRPIVDLLVVIVVAEDLSLTQAIKRVWQIMVSHFRPLAAISAWLLAIEGIFFELTLFTLSSLIQVVMVFETFQTSGTNFGHISEAVMFGVFALVILLAAFAQGIMTTYHLSAMTLAYLNLKKKTDLTKIQLESA